MGLVTGVKTTYLVGLRRQQRLTMWLSKRQLQGLELKQSRRMSYIFCGLIFGTLVIASVVAFVQQLI